MVAVALVGLAVGIFVGALLDDRTARRTKIAWDRDYWRTSYEALVKQTGRDLNDGLGLDPRKTPTKETP